MICLKLLYDDVRTYVVGDMIDAARFYRKMDYCRIMTQINYRPSNFRISQIKRDKEKFIES